MNKTNNIHRFLIMSIIIFSCLVALPQDARADTIGTMEDILNKIHEVYPNTDLPSGNDIEGLKGVFSCFDGGKDVGECLDEYSGAMDNYHINKMVDLYVAVKNDDFWGVIGIVGEEALCVIAEIMTGGGGGGALCKLIEDIVNFAIDILEGIGKVLQAFGKVVEDAYCLVFGCSPEPGPQKSLAQTILDLDFIPKLGDAMTAIYGADMEAYEKLCNKISSDSIKKFEKGSKQYYTPEYWPTAVQEYKEATAAAEKEFRNLAYAKWDEAMVKWVLQALGQKRSEFNSATKIESHAYAAIQSYEASPQQWNAGVLINDSCTKTFTETYKFAHVDNWIVRNPDKAQSLKLLPNNKWCTTVFWDGNQLQFANRFRNYLTKEKGWCQEDAQTITCDTPDHFNECAKLLGSVGQAKQCGANVALWGMQIAQEVDAYFKEQGSKIPCKYEKPQDQNTPVDFICERPTQQNECNKYYSGHFSTLPVKVLNCGLNETDDYKNLKDKVKSIVEILKQGGNLHASEKEQISVSKSVDASLKQPAALNNKTTTADGSKKTAVLSPQGKTPSLSLSTVTMPCPDPKLEVPSPVTQDPLVVYGATCIVEKVKRDPDQNFGFGPPSIKPGFDYNLQNVNLIDGASTPVLNEVGYSDIDKGVLGKIIADKSRTTVTPESQGKQILGSDNVSGKMRERITKPKINPVSGEDQIPVTPGTKIQTGSIKVTQPSSVAPTIPTPTNVPGATPMTKIVSPPSAGTPIPVTPPVAQFTTPVKPPTVTPADVPKTTVKSGTVSPPPAATPTTVIPPVAQFTTPVKPPTVAQPPAVNLPDITAIDQLRVGNQSVKWGSTLTVDAGQAVSKNKNNSGLCEFTIEYGVHNAGKASTGSFRTKLMNSSTNGSWQHTWNALGADTSKIEQDVVQLQTGSNTLQFILDDQKQLQEADETNNMSRVNINVTGNCGAAIQTMPTVPVPTTPAVPTKPVPKLKGR
jgi:CARDB